MKHHLVVATFAASDIAALPRLWPSVPAVTRGAHTPHRWVATVGADGVTLVLAEVAVWLTALWLGIGLLAALARALPGSAGRAGDWLARRTLPAALYRLCATAVGLSVLAGPVAAGAAPVAPRRAPGCVVLAAVADASPPAWSPPAPPPPVWPTGGAVPAPTWPQGRATPATPPAPPTRAVPPASHPPSSPPAGSPVTVRPGDSLWLIAARRLGSDATLRQIELGWRDWYAANRTLIGADPGLIRPGQVLVDPDARTQSAVSSKEAR